MWRKRALTANSVKRIRYFILYDRRTQLGIIYRKNNNMQENTRKSFLEPVTKNTRNPVKVQCIFG